MTRRFLCFFSLFIGPLFAVPLLITFSNPNDILFSPPWVCVGGLLLIAPASLSQFGDEQPGLLGARYYALQMLAHREPVT